MNGLLEKARLMFAHDVTVLTGIEKGCVKVVPLTQGKVTIVDEDDYDHLNKIRWQTRVQGENLFYAQAYKGKGETPKVMHRVIMGLKMGDKLDVDHMNHDGLDNRKRNLRTCTRSQNNMNRLPQQGGASKYKGVVYHKGVAKWWARIKINRKTISLGLYNKESLAALAYNNAALKYFGEFAYLNVIEDI